MLTVPQAVERLRQLQTELGIPGEARLQFIEKRHIELSDSEEIEPVYPYPEGTVESDQCVETTPDDVPSFDGSDNAAADGEIENLAVHLVWVGKFVYRFMFWELAIDREGTLVRIKKAR